MTEKEKLRLEGLWAFDCEKGGGRPVFGIDEVGRGPLAGPVVTACVIVPPDKLVLGVNDSKKVAEKKREKLYDLLMERAEYVRTGWRTPQVIDEINILAATKAAMEEAAAAAENAHFLVDAVTGLHLPGPATPIIHGDAISYMIAAASIIAKVTRDKLMLAYHEQYPHYGFDSNKGYGTRAHYEGLAKYGLTPIHRKSFLKNL